MIKRLVQVAIIIIFFILLYVFGNRCDGDSTVYVNEYGDIIYAEKPVLYLYPEYEPTNMDISLCIKTINDDVTYDDINLFTYPEFTTGLCWTCSVKPDGLISTWFDYDEELNKFTTHKDSRYLFWESRLDNLETNGEWQYCVKGEDTISFLEDILTQYGLNDIERTDFITYWAPRLMKNPYNLITFDTNYTDIVHYEFSINDKTPEGQYRLYHEPQTFIRVFMAYQSTNEEKPCVTPSLPEIPTRDGFTAVEWGGSCYAQG